MSSPFSPRGADPVLDEAAPIWYHRRVGTREALKTAIALTLALLGLLAAFVVYDGLSMTARQYYRSLSAGVDRLGVNGVDTPADLANCDMATCINVLAGTMDDSAVKVGACDVFMYNGGVAVVGFLCFLLVYYGFLVAGRILVSLFPPRWREGVLLAWSVVFLVVALPLRPAFWVLDLVVFAWLVVNLPASPRLRAGLLAIAVAVFYATVGGRILEVCSNEFFSLSRMNFGEVPGALRSIVGALHLGQPGASRLADEGYPYVFLAMALLLKTFRRMLWLVYELWVGRVDRPAPLVFFLYFLGLHALIGNAATPSLREFAESAGRRAPSDGAWTLASCIGLATLAYTAIVMMGYSPAVRLLFPRCDLASAPPHVVWAKLGATLVIDYLFLLATEQASIGVARLFGFGLRDNYAHPLLARNLADFWRRWNIYWREFLVAVFYYPVSLRLARLGGRQTGGHVMMAALATFAGTFVLNVLPLALLAARVDGGWMGGQGTQPGPGIAAGPQGNGWMALIPSLAVYYGLEGLIVGATLVAEHARRERRPSPMWWTIIAVGTTFATVAAIRCFLDASMGFDEQLRTLARALGAGW